MNETLVDLNNLESSYCFSEKLVLRGSGGENNLLSCLNKSDGLDFVKYVQLDQGLDLPDLKFVRFFKSIKAILVLTDRLGSLSGLDGAPGLKTLVMKSKRGKSFKYESFSNVNVSRLELYNATPDDFLYLNRVGSVDSLLLSGGREENFSFIGGLDVEELEVVGSKLSYFHSNEKVNLKSLRLYKCVNFVGFCVDVFSENVCFSSCPSLDFSCVGSRLGCFNLRVESRKDVVDMGDVFKISGLKKVVFPNSRLGCSSVNQVPDTMEEVYCGGFSSDDVRNLALRFPDIHWRN